MSFSVAEMSALLARNWRLAAVGRAVQQGRPASTQAKDVDWSTKRWEVPDRLKTIPEQVNPNFFNMVEYFFHRACVLAEEELMDSLHRMRGVTNTDKRKKVTQCTSDQHHSYSHCVSSF